MVPLRIGNEARQDFVGRQGDVNHGGIPVYTGWTAPVRMIRPSAPGPKRLDPLVLRFLACLTVIALLAGGPPVAAARTAAADQPPTSPAGQSASELPVVNDARVVGDGERTRFIMDVSDEVAIGAFTLADPYRVIVDLPEVRFELPDDAGLTGRGLLTGWRYGLFARGRSRIVLDATEPVKIDRAFVLPSVDGQPARMVVDLVRTTPRAFQEELARTALTREASNDVAASKADRLPEAGQARTRPLVVLDAGHGGIDTGTVAGSGVKEKDVVLSFAFELKRRLEATGKVDVHMTREEDRFISLRDRVKIGREQAADLFVSIHADSVKQDFVRGATVYTLAERATDQDAAALAEKENASDVIAGLDQSGSTADEVAGILVDLTRRETMNFASAFANGLVSELSSTTRMIRNPHRSAGFMVLRAPDVPSVLLEIGYLSNEQDEKLLTSNEWRDRVTEAVTGAILRFFGPKFAAASN